MSAPPPPGPMSCRPSGASSVPISRMIALGGVRSREAESRRREDAGVGFDRQDVLPALSPGGVAIRVAAAQAVLLVREQHHAHGPPRADIQLLHQPRGFPRHDAPHAIVRRAGADVPRIEVAADEHDLVRQLAPANLADHVGRFDVGLEARLHLAGARARAGRGRRGAESARRPRRRSPRPESSARRRRNSCRRCAACAGPSARPRGRASRPRRARGRAGAARAVLHRLAVVGVGRR